MRTVPHGDRGRKSVRLRLDHVTCCSAGTDNDGGLDTRDVRKIVGIGEAADVAAGRAWLADRIAGCGCGSVGDRSVEGEDFSAAEAGC